MREHDEEPVMGLPEKLPMGEKLLWQGRPDTWALARRALHINKIALWFLTVAGWRIIAQWQHSRTVDTSQLAVTVLAFLLAMALILFLAYLLASSTLYSLTNKRVTIRLGIAIQITLNLPFSQILSASVKTHRNGNGNIALTVSKDQRLSYVVLWPHVRPLYFGNIQPMLRNIPDIEEVAQLLLKSVSNAQATSPSAGSDALAHNTAGLTI